MNMIKTLRCNINENVWGVPKYIKVTATKIDEIEHGVENLYEDENGNRYVVTFNKFQRREEFVRL